MAALSPRIARFAAPLVAMFAGCEATRSEIDGSDGSTFFPGVHASWTLTPPDGETQRVPDDHWAVELDVSYSSSEFDQDLGAGELASVGDQLFVGPAKLDVDFDLWRTLYDIRGTWERHNGLGAEVIFGTEIDRLHIEIEDQASGKDDEESLLTLGPLLGGAFFYEPLDWLHLYAQATFAPSFTSEFEGVNITALEAGARLRFHEHAAVLAGWRDVHFDAERDDLDSDLDLRASGPAVTLWLGW